MDKRNFWLFSPGYPPPILASASRIIWTFTYLAIVILVEIQGIVKHPALKKVPKIFFSISRTTITVSKFEWLDIFLIWVNSIVGIDPITLSSWVQLDSWSFRGVNWSWYINKEYRNDVIQRFRSKSSNRKINCYFEGVSSFSLFWVSFEYIHT